MRFPECVFRIERRPSSRKGLGSYSRKAPAKQPLPAKDLYYLGMAQLQTKQDAKGRETLARALAAGLQDPLAQEAKASTGRTTEVTRIRDQVHEDHICRKPLHFCIGERAALKKYAISTPDN